MANIDNFKGQFANLARPNRFKVTGFDLPGGGAGDLEYHAKGAQLPATNLGVMDVPYMGRVIKYDGDRTYEDFTFTLYGGAVLDNRQYFENWSNLMNDPVENTGEIQKVDGQIILLDRQNKPIKTFQIVGALVTNIAAVDLDWATNDTPLEFSVTIAYDYHTVV